MKQALISMMILATGLSAFATTAPTSDPNTVVSTCKFESEGYKVVVTFKMVRLIATTEMTINDKVIPALTKKCVEVPARGLGGTGLRCVHQKGDFRVDLYPTFGADLREGPKFIRGLATEGDSGYLHFPQLNCVKAEAAKP